MGGQNWLLHVLDVEGEDDIMAITLKVDRSSVGTFADEFTSLFQEKSSLHLGAAVCPGCRPDDREEWTPLFWDWVSSAYAAMSSPPEAVDEDEVPTAVRVSLEALACAEYGDPTSLN